VTSEVQLLAAGLALAGSGCYAVATVTQHGVARQLPSERAFDLVVLIRLARRPIWLAGMAAVIAGFVLQAVALGLGRLVVIEPVLATSLLFALALAARRDRRSLRPAEWAATLAVVGGLAVFLAVGQPTGGQRTADATLLGLATAATAALVGLCTVVARRLGGHHRALLFGVAGGIAAGTTDAVIKTVTVLAAGHLLGVFADVRLYLLIAIGLLTFTIQQNGYRAAALAAFLPAFAVFEPVTGSLLGLLIYHERLSDGPGQIVVELAACAVAVWGIARLAGPAMAGNTPPVAGTAAPPLPIPAVPAGQRGQLGKPGAADPGPSR
jgi:drug/metabolite transporter (DMT)-like permease